MVANAQTPEADFCQQCLADSRNACPFANAKSRAEKATLCKPFQNRFAPEIITSLEGACCWCTHPNLCECPVERQIQGLKTSIYKGKAI